ncbi:EAL domain-containing protein [Xylophilus sp. Kf1]|nr:EAL domain-containing protein [Xylophilus sp. Kf1]
MYRAPIGLMETTLDGTIELANPKSATLLMPLSADGNLDNLFSTLKNVAPWLPQTIAEFAEPSGSILDGMRLSVEHHGGGGLVQQTLSLSVMKLDGQRLMAMVSDVTQEVAREQTGLAQSLKAAARVDALTQMPNRAAIWELVNNAMLRESAEGTADFAVLFINCDRFKQINDSLGHAAGDELLSLIAERLRSTLRQERRVAHATLELVEKIAADTAGRIGGDEFVVLIGATHSAEDAHHIAKRLLSVLSKPYGVQTHRLHIGISMGLVLREQMTGDADAVLQDASIAMREAKQAGGARYRVFEPAMHERALRRGVVEIELRRALSHDQLFVVYQPVVDLQDDGVDSGLPPHAAGVEALVRWRHPERGLIPPIDFIGVAEECGLIGEIGNFVLLTACRQFMQWQGTLGADAPRLLAVNLSRGQLIEPGFAQVVAGVLAATGMNPAQLQLEITESLAAQDEAVQAELRALQALGLTLALDDFGTGYSSLSSLHQLPVSTVKIDRSFVSEAVSSAHHRVLIEATIRVAKSLGMGTVAEGIETREQAALLKDLGCRKGQGYHFCKPLPFEELVPWLQCST